MRVLKTKIEDEVLQAIIEVTVGAQSTLNHIDAEQTKLIEERKEKGLFSYEDEKYRKKRDSIMRALLLTIEKAVGKLR